MRRGNLSEVALITIATATFLTGSAGASQIGRPASLNASGVSSAAARGLSHQTASWMKPEGAGAGLAYISDFLANAVTVFSVGGTVQGQIGGLSNPGGVVVDSKHNLWVANNGANTVLEFARGATTPSTTLSDPGGPIDVTICRRGTVYVAGSNSTSIEVYPKGSTSPARSLTFAGVQQNDGITCDAAGNVFVTVVLSFHGGVVEFPGGKQGGATQLPITLSGPGGIKPDNAGNLLVDDQSAQTITEYTEAGAATGNAIHTASDCINFGVMRDSKIVGCAVYAASGISEGQSYAFPAGTVRQTYSSAFTLPYGFAFDPGQKGV
jgi:hypothetical protein